MIALERTLWVAAVVAAASAGVAGAQDAVDVAKAKAEGKVVWYTSTPIEQGQKIADAFEKEIGIKVEMFRSGGSAILRRFQQEMDAGRVAADVLTTPIRRPPMRSARRACSSRSSRRTSTRCPTPPRIRTACSSPSGST